MFAEELHCLIYGHFENVVNVLFLILHLEYVAFEALAVATLTLQHKVGHELHLHLYRALALAFLATAAIGIE